MTDQQSIPEDSGDTQKNQNNQVVNADAISEKKKKNRVKSMGWFLFSLIVISLLSALYWFFFIRGIEETDDAYVGGNQIMISSQIPGSVAQINVGDMDYVHEGDVLVILNDKDRKLALVEAENQLANVVRNIQKLRYTIKELQAAKAMKEIVVTQTKSDYDRRLRLVKTQSVVQEVLDHTKDAYEEAKASLKVTTNQLDATIALLGKASISDDQVIEQPSVKEAIAGVRLAWINLQRTKILSPANGYIAKRNAQVGETLGAGRPIMAVVPDNQMWVDANFKETQLRDMRIGQKAKVVFDFYGDDLVFEGKVAGMEMGTGSAFSLLPPQNATGNWIKIVQRVPVRITLDPEEMKKYPLRLGLSATVNINVTDTDGTNLRQTKRLKPLYTTNVLNYDESTLDQRIQQIIQNNMGQ